MSEKIKEIYCKYIVLKDYEADTNTIEQSIYDKCRNELKSTKFLNTSAL